MCGRFAQFIPSDKIKDEFEIVDDEAPDLPFNFNAAPTDTVKMIVQNGERKAVPIRWGLVTKWSQGKNFSLINVRDDSFREKKTFNYNLEKERCIIPADGFFEWLKDTTPKTPYFIHLKSGEPLAFAGIYNVLEGKDNLKEKGTEIRSAAIITTRSNSYLEKLHDRMPVILPKSRWAEWLDNKHFDKDKLLSYLAPYPDEEMEAYVVTTEVNSSKNNKPEFVVKAGMALNG